MDYNSKLKYEVHESFTKAQDGIDKLRFMGENTLADERQASLDSIIEATTMVEALVGSLKVVGDDAEDFKSDAKISINKLMKDFDNKSSAEQWFKVGFTPIGKNGNKVDMTELRKATREQIMSMICSLTMVVSNQEHISIPEVLHNVQINIDANMNYNN